jgi:hypothetical protein
MGARDKLAMKVVNSVMPAIPWRIQSLCNNEGNRADY